MKKGKLSRDQLCLAPFEFTLFPGVHAACGRQKEQGKDRCSLHLSPEDKLADRLSDIEYRLASIERRLEENT